MLVNLTYNPICVLSRVRVGDVIDDLAGHELIRAVIDEIGKVAGTRGRTIRDDAVKFIFSVGENHRSHKTLMRHDIEERRRTEIDYLGGTVVEYVDEGGVSVPVNRALTRFAVASTTRSTIGWSQSHWIASSITETSTEQSCISVAELRHR